VDIAITAVFTLFFMTETSSVAGKAIMDKIRQQVSMDKIRQRGAMYERVWAILGQLKYATLSDIATLDETYDDEAPEHQETFQRGLGIGATAVVAAILQLDNDCPDDLIDELANGGLIGAAKIVVTHHPKTENAQDMKD
jgi:hypothetical protein